MRRVGLQHIHIAFQRFASIVVFRFHRYPPSTRSDTRRTVVFLAFSLFGFVVRPSSPDLTRSQTRSLTGIDHHTFRQRHSRILDIRYREPFRIVKPSCGTFKSTVKPAGVSANVVSGATLNRRRKPRCSQPDEPSRRTRRIMRHEPCFRLWSDSSNSSTLNPRRQRTFTRCRQRQKRFRAARTCRHNHNFRRCIVCRS